MQDFIITEMESIYNEAKSLPSNSRNIHIMLESLREIYYMTQDNSITPNINLNEEFVNLYNAIKDAPDLEESQALQLRMEVMRHLSITNK